jgi:hypothetical protein
MTSARQVEPVPWVSLVVRYIYAIVDACNSPFVKYGNGLSLRLAVIPAYADIIIVGKQRSEVLHLMVKHLLHSSVNDPCITQKRKSNTPENR